MHVNTCQQPEKSAQLPPHTWRGFEAARRMVIPQSVGKMSVHGSKPNNTVMEEVQGPKEPQLAKPSWSWSRNRVRLQIKAPCS